MTIHRQVGATAVEFALVLLLFLTFLLGVLDFSRMLYTWNAASEATRWGARTAVVCNVGAAAVLKNMKKFLPQLTADNVTIDWYNQQGIPNTCNADTCAGVNVRISGLNYQWISPIVGAVKLPSFLMPNFATYLPREVMGQDPQSSQVCS